MGSEQKEDILNDSSQYRGLDSIQATSEYTTFCISAGNKSVCAVVYFVMQIQRTREYGKKPSDCLFTITKLVN